MAPAREPVSATWLHVGAVGLWTPGRPDVAAWLAAQPGAGTTPPAAALLPAIVRRRTSLLTRAAVEAFGQCAAAAGVEAATVATVFGSAWGETSALQELLDQLYVADGSLSPIRFSGSVHNAASGHLSIATGNQGFTTSLAAGRDTVAMALCESLGLLAAGHPEVVAVFADIDPPTPLADRSGHCAPLAVALHLHRGLPGRPVLAHLAGPVPAGDAASPAKPRPFAHLDADAAAALAANPCAPALDLADAVLRQRKGRVDLGAWRVDVTFPAGHAHVAGGAP